MDWLTLVTPDEMERVGKNANTIEELEAVVMKYVRNKMKVKHTYEPICSECGSKLIVVIDGADTCARCGTSAMNNFTYYVSYNHNKDDYLKKKSSHNRVRWFERHLFEHVASLVIIESVGLRDTYSSMLLLGIGIPYGSSLEAS
ncbi:Hypothetical predicted protein [Paramuricea clavata]|uniref:Uncharacterized protein n=1 Tax=Paramuricea clavata TaxID=317549 RepID=A0A6S7FLH2_PARCT|nr:Hypothetical predicted protein [Paramuricea clavata]